MNKHLFYKSLLATALFALTATFILVKSHNRTEIQPQRFLGSDTTTEVKALETQTSSQDVWKELEDKGIVVNGKIKSEYLNISEVKSTTKVINKTSDLTNYVEFDDITDGNDIEGIFPDLRIKWESGKSYYDTQYISRGEHADGDISGKYTKDLTVKWANGKSYYDTLYQAIGSSSVSELDDLSDVTINLASIDDNYTDNGILWNATNSQWEVGRISPNIEAGNGLENSNNQIMLGGSLDFDTSIDTTDLTLTFGSENPDTPEYMTVNEDLVTFDTMVKIATDNNGALQLSSYGENQGPTCTTSIEGAVSYDNALKRVCYCDGSSWLQISDEATQCFQPGS